MNTCKICKNENNNIIHVAKEMMFGLRDNFRYLECNNCGCLQLIDESPDFSKYYPVNYYSYNRLNVNFDKKIKDKIETLLIKYSLKSFSPGYYFLSKIFGIHHYSKWLKTAKVKYDYKNG